MVGRAASATGATRAPRPDSGAGLHSRGVIQLRTRAKALTTVAGALSAYANTALTARVGQWGDARPETHAVSPPGDPADQIAGALFVMLGERPR
jgi:hypothetical protein